jgi:hypothetical protein
MSIICPGRKSITDSDVHALDRVKTVICWVSHSIRQAKKKTIYFRGVETIAVYGPVYRLGSVCQLDRYRFISILTAEQPECIKASVSIPTCYLHFIPYVIGSIYLYCLCFLHIFSAKLCGYSLFCVGKSGERTKLRNSCSTAYPRSRPRRQAPKWQTRARWSVCVG